MINTSRAYKEAVAGDNGLREFCIADRIIFADGTQISLSLEDVLAYSINDATTEAGKFQVGAAVVKEYTVTLNNFEKKFKGYDFEGADITADIGLKLADGTWEILRKGKFRVIKAREIEQTVNVTAYDSMLFFDRPYSDSTLQFPTTILQVIRGACVDCQMTFDASSVEMAGYVIRDRPQDGALTYRDMISYCAQIMGCFARINRLDTLEFSWYHFDVAGIINAGGFYGNLDVVSGGTFRNIPSDVLCAEFGRMGENHHFYDLKSKSINTDDITISGVRILPDAEEQAAVDYGADGYRIVIEGNPLIQSTGDAETVMRHIGPKLTGKSFRPYSVTLQSDPCREAGDTVLISQSASEDSILSVLTNTTFSIGGAQRAECSAETPTEKTYTKYSAQTRILEKSKQEAGRQMDLYDVAVQQMNQLAANTMGFYATTVRQKDGSIIAYRHDKASLSDSKVVYKSGIDGFWVTQDFRGTDAATTAAGKWRAGFDSNGNAVLNMLSVIGINFSWAHGGVLTLGGNGNGNGTLRILDEKGNQVGYIDNTGVNFNKGTFSGELSGATGTFSGTLEAASGTFKGVVRAGEVDGSLIKTYNVYGTEGIEMEAGVQRFYWQGQHFGTMEPMSEIILDESTGDESEVPYLDFSCAIMTKQLGQTSDERKKKISSWDERYDTLLMELQPVLYSWADDGSRKKYTGFGAQAVQGLLDRLGIRNSGLVYGREETGYGIMYSDFHAMEIAAIQRNRALIQNLEARIKKLEERAAEEGE